MHRTEMLDLYLLTKRSRNRKVGHVPVSMSNAMTCPPSCKMWNACYARYGKLGIVWARLNYGKLTNMTDWSNFCRQVSRLNCTMWRHNQAGDLPGQKNKLHRGRCLQLARANAADGRNRGGYTYTHYPVTETDGVRNSVLLHNREVIRDMNALGFVVNLSADSLAHADELAELNIGPVATVLHSDDKRGIHTPSGRKVRVCPAVLHHEVNCVDCKVCAVSDRDTIIGFPAHGAGKKRVNAMVEPCQQDG